MKYSQTNVTDPQVRRARLPFTTVGKIKQDPLVPKLPTPPPMPASALQKAAALLVDRTPTIPWFMRYPYRPVLSFLTAIKAGAEGGVEAGRRIRYTTSRALDKLRQRRGYS